MPDATVMTSVPETGLPPGAGQPRRQVEYEEFRVGIDGAAGEYQVSVYQSPAGDSSAPVTVRWSPETGWLEKESELRRFGTRLFNTFFVGEIRDLYRDSVTLTRDREHGLRIRLLIGPRDLTREPWELLFDTTNKRVGYLGLSSRTPVVRHPRLGTPIKPLLLAPPLRILCMAANPKDPALPLLDVDNERRVVESALGPARDAGRVEFKWLDGGTWEQLQAEIKQGWHAFHFVGHGEYDADAGQGYLVLENSKGGPRRLSGEELALLLREEGKITFAVLNSCQGAVGSSDAASSTADALALAGMNGIVAMQNPIGDAAAITFAQVFYLGVASGLPLEAAVTSARVAIKLEQPDPIEWWTPVLHMRSETGELVAVGSAPPASTVTIPGGEYFGPDLDAPLEKALARQRRRKRAILAWALAPLPLLGFLMMTSVSSVFVRADIEATGATFVLAAERELFSDPPRLRSFSATSFQLLKHPNSVFPVPPPADLEPEISARAEDEASWISLEPWTLPRGAQITLDHPRDSRSREYVLSLATRDTATYTVGLVNRIALSQFGATPELHDYADTATLGLIALAPRFELEFAQPGNLTIPQIPIDQIRLIREVQSGRGALSELTMLRARVRFKGFDTAMAATPLELENLREAAIENLRLTDSGLAFTLQGQVHRVVSGRKQLPFPSRFDWLLRDAPWYLGLGVLAYLLVSVTVILAGRTHHARKITAA